MRILGRILLAEISLFLLIFPLENFRFNIASPIFPSFEIIILYYYSTYSKINVFVIFVLGVIFDELYFMPLGTNSIVLISGHIFLKFMGKFFKLESYITNFMVFCLYYLLIIHFRYLLIMINNPADYSYFVILVQYLMTIFSYNLLRIISDKILQIFKPKLS